MANKTQTCNHIVTKRAARSAEQHFDVSAKDVVDKIFVATNIFHPYSQTYEGGFKSKLLTVLNI